MRNIFPVGDMLIAYADKKRTDALETIPPAFAIRPKKSTMHFIVHPNITEFSVFNIESRNLTRIADYSYKAMFTENEYRFQYFNTLQFCNKNIAESVQDDELSCTNVLARKRLVCSLCLIVGPDVLTNFQPLFYDGMNLIEIYMLALCTNHDFNARRFQKMTFQFICCLSAPAFYFCQQISSNIRRN